MNSSLLHGWSERKRDLSIKRLESIMKNKRLIRILEISQNSPTTNRDIVGNWVKLENKKKLPNEIEESTENDG